MRSPPDEPSAKQDLDTVGIISEALVEKFGEGSLHVAEQQLIAACSESRKEWEAIVSRLKSQEARLG